MKKNWRFARERWPALALLILVVVAGLAFGYRVSQGRWIESSLITLLPPLHRESSVQIAMEGFRNTLDREIVLLAGHPRRDQARSAAARLWAELSATDGVASVQGRFSEAQLRAWADFYGQFRYQLLTPELRGMLSRNQGQQWVQRVLSQIFSPTGAVSSGELAEDPFLLLRNFLLNQRDRGAKAVQMDEGWAMIQDDDGMWYALMPAELNFDVYSFESARVFTDRIDTIETELKNEFPGFVLNRTGAVFYASYGSRSAEREVSIISIGSMIGNAVIALLVFRSFLPLVWVLLSIGCGLVVACAVTLLITGPLHVFTTVFGSSLVGVSVDYSLYFLCDRLVSGHRYVPGKTLRRIARAITICLVTSLMSYLALLATPAPVLRQIAVFSAVGLMVTFAVVVLWFPLLAPSAPSRPWRGQSPFRIWQAGWRIPARYFKWILVSVTAVLVALAAGIHVTDDLHQLQAAPPALTEQEKVISRLTGMGLGTQMLLVQGASAEQMLQRLEEAGNRLDTLRANGALEGYRSVSGLLPSQARQEQDVRQVKERLVPSGFPMLRSALGLDPSTRNRILDSPMHPLLPEMWLASPISTGLRNLVHVSPDGTAYSVVLLQGVQRTGEVGNLASEVPGTHYINFSREVSETLRIYRQRVGFLSAAAYGLILVLLVRLYRLRRAILILAPPVLGAVSGLALLRVLGLPLNLFSLFGIVLVLGVGIDYPLVLAENKEHHPFTLLSIPLSAGATLLSFGLLALSSTPALSNFGLVVLCGITVSFLMAPVALAARVPEIEHS